MNERESVDVESAYGSEISSNSETLRKRDTFTIEKPKSRNQIRWKWLKHKIRDYMVLEAIFFLILIFLLITCYRISSQNKETHETILNIQSQLNSFQGTTGNDFMKQIISQTQETQRLISIIQSQLNSLQNPTGRGVLNVKEEIKKVDKNGSEKTKEMLEEILKEVRMKSVVQLQQSQSINKSLSSNKAWCTSEKNPVLTVNLAKYVNTTAVSYQHSKWNDTIPDGAPKEYSVVACLDIKCMTWKPLFSHCEYKQHGLQEQICNNVSNDSISSPVTKLQFRFHKNHGNTERTCVSSVRVYSEKEVVPEQEFRGLEDTTTCLDLSHNYRNNPKTYKDLIVKNCTLLHSKGCCQECPECCDGCKVISLGDIFLFLLLVSFMCMVIFLFFYTVYVVVLDSCAFCLKSVRSPASTTT